VKENVKDNKEKETEEKEKLELEKKDLEEKLRVADAALKEYLFYSPSLLINLVFAFPRPLLFLIAYDLGPRRSLRRP